MHIPNEVITFLVSVFGGGSIGGGVGIAMVRAYMRTEAQEALKETVKDLYVENEALHKRINHIENDYVLCKYCDMQHSNLKNTIEGMDHKLDILIENKMR